jgi:excisionase family DNA binding protein
LCGGESDLTETFRTTKEISDLLNVSEETVRRWIRSGELKATLDGKSYLVEEKVLEKFLEEKAKVSGTSIAKMANNLGIAAGVGAAAAAVNPLLGAGILGLASFVNKGLKKSGDPKSNQLSQNQSNEPVDLKDIEDFIASLRRKKKKIELEFQMNLLEIDDQIANYEKLKEQIEKRGNSDEKG